MVNFFPFDGKYEDNFTRTSLHLRFTGSTLPVNASLPQMGDRFHRAFYYETVVQVYDQGTWVADLDILKSIESFRHGWGRGCVSMGKVYRPLVVVDNWNELLDEQPSSSIVRATDNQLARVAIASVLAQLGRRFRIVHRRDYADYKPHETDVGTSNWLADKGRESDNDEDFVQGITGLGDENSEDDTSEDDDNDNDTDKDDCDGVDKTEQDHNSRNNEIWRDTYGTLQNYDGEFRPWRKEDRGDNSDSESDWPSDWFQNVVYIC